MITRWLSGPGSDREVVDPAAGEAALAGNPRADTAEVFSPSELLDRLMGDTDWRTSSSRASWATIQASSES